MNRNLQDAMVIARNNILNVDILQGGGATEMALGAFLQSNSGKISCAMAWPYRAVANSLEVISKILIENCGEPPICVLTELRAKHNDEKYEHRFVCGVNGNTCKIASMKAIESAAMFETYINYNLTVLKEQKTVQSTSSELKEKKEKNKGTKKKTRTITGTIIFCYFIFLIFLVFCCFVCFVFDSRKMLFLFFFCVICVLTYSLDANLYANLYAN